MSTYPNWIRVEAARSDAPRHLVILATTVNDPMAPLLTAWVLTLLSHQSPEDLPRHEAVALTDGIDTPSLIDLAARSRTDHPAELREPLRLA